MKDTEDSDLKDIISAKNQLNIPLKLLVNKTKNDSKVYVDVISKLGKEAANLELILY